MWNAVPRRSKIYGRSLWKPPGPAIGHCPEAAVCCFDVRTDKVGKWQSYRLYWVIKLEYRIGEMLYTVVAEERVCIRRRTLRLSGSGMSLLTTKALPRHRLRCLPCVG